MRVSLGHVKTKCAFHNSDWYTVAGRDMAAQCACPYTAQRCLVMNVRIPTSAKNTSNTGSNGSSNSHTALALAATTTTATA